MDKFISKEVRDIYEDLIQRLNKTEIYYVKSYTQTWDVYIGAYLFKGKLLQPKKTSLYILRIWRTHFPL